MTDEEILLSLHQGSEGAFSALYDRYAARGMNYAYSFLQNRSDSEEAVQEAFCRLLKPLKRGAVSPERGGFCALFFGTLRNLCIDAMRRRKHRNHLPLESVPEPVADVVEDRTELLQARVRTAMESLPPNQADALKLKLGSDLSYDQIAEVLRCTRAQVRTWIFRARRALEQEFGRQGLIEGRRERRT